MKTFIIRGAFTNQFELQNYEILSSKYTPTVIASKHPITETTLPTIKLFSPYDLPSFPLKLPFLNRLYGDAHYLYGLEESIRGADIVHVAETYYGYTHQAIEMKKKGLINKLVSTCWETIPHNNEGIYPRRRWKAEAFYYIDHFITPTVKAKQALIAEGCEERKITVIPMGVNLSRFQPNRDKHEGKVRILFVGRLVPEKGIDTLLAALEGMEDKVAFRVVGEGSVGTPGVTREYVSYDNMPSVYQWADIFVFPSRSTKAWEEQYGMALIEAMATGLPVVASRSGAIPEVLGDAGMLFKEGDVKELQYCLKTLIGYPSLRDEVGAKALARACDCYDRRNTASKIEGIYNRLYV